MKANCPGTGHLPMLQSPSKLESYEDTLNNLQLRRIRCRAICWTRLPQQRPGRLPAQPAGRGKPWLAAVGGGFQSPSTTPSTWQVDSAWARSEKPRKMIWSRPSNFLIGLRVKHIDAQPQRGFIVTGTLPSNETCLVLWRDCELD